MSKDDGFYSKENIKYLEDLKKRDDESKLKFTKHELIET